MGTTGSCEGLLCTCGALHWTRGIINSIKWAKCQSTFCPVIESLCGGAVRGVERGERGRIRRRTGRTCPHRVVPVRTGSYLSAPGRTLRRVVVPGPAWSYPDARGRTVERAFVPFTLLRYDRAGARTTARAPSASSDGFPTSVRRPRARSGAQGLIRSVDDLGVKTSSRMRHAAPTAPARHPSGSASRVMGRAAP